MGIYYTILLYKQKGKGTTYMTLYLSHETDKRTLDHIASGDGVVVHPNQWVDELGRCAVVYGVDAIYRPNVYWRGLGVRWIVRPSDPDALSNLHLREEVEILGITIYPLTSKNHGE